MPTLRQDPATLKVSADRNTQEIISIEDDLDFDPEVVAKRQAKLAKSASESYFLLPGALHHRAVGNPPL